MFKNLFGKKEKGLSIKAPVDGQMIPLEDVPDAVFSAKIMGDGAAVMLEGDKVVAPADGTVALVADTKHAIALNLADGTELLVHVGIDTVNLKGEGFNPLVKVGDTVTAGQVMMEVDKAVITAAGYSLATPVIVCNTPDHPIKSYAGKGAAAAGETELFVL